MGSTVYRGVCIQAVCPLLLNRDLYRLLGQPSRSSRACPKPDPVSDNSLSFDPSPTVAVVHCRNDPLPTQHNPGAPPHTSHRQGLPACCRPAGWAAQCAHISRGDHLPFGLPSELDPKLRRHVRDRHHRPLAVQTATLRAALDAPRQAFQVFLRGRVRCPSGPWVTRWRLSRRADGHNGRHFEFHHLPRAQQLNRGAPSSKESKEW